MALPRHQPSALPAAEALEDAELVARVLEGDDWSRDILYRRHARRLLVTATRLMIFAPLELRPLIERRVVEMTAPTLPTTSAGPRLR